MNEKGKGKERDDFQGVWENLTIYQFSIRTRIEVINLEDLRKENI